MKKRRVLVITKQSLFGAGIVSLLEEQEPLEFEKVRDVRTAINRNARFQADVVLCFIEKKNPDDELLLQEMVARYHTRVIRCTLEADQLTIMDRTRIQKATFEDLMREVMK